MTIRRLGPLRRPIRLRPIAGRRLRPADTPSDEPKRTRSNETHPIGYIGLPGYRNLGDDAMLAAVERLLPQFEFAVNPTRAKATMIGGGTLFNAGRYYQNRMRRVDPGTPPYAVFGTGVRSPEYWGVTEDYERWRTFLDESVVVGVRGPDSARWLADLGFEGSVDVLGDPALALEHPEVAPVEGHVLIAPLHTAGELHGRDDAAVLKGITATAQRLLDAGHPLTLMSSHPNDDRWVLEIMRSLGTTDIGYLAGYDDVDVSLRTIASAELVVGERLHASILAAAADTSFVAVAYRPKVLDFARSVDQEDAVVQTDDIGRLDEIVDTVWAQRAQRVATVAAKVQSYRTKQRRAAKTFADAVEAATY